MGSRIQVRKQSALAGKRFFDVEGGEASLAYVGRVLPMDFLPRRRSKTNLASCDLNFPDDISYSGNEVGYVGYISTSIISGVCAIPSTLPLLCWKSNRLIHGVSGSRVGSSHVVPPLRPPPRPSYGGRSRDLHPEPRPFAFCCLG
jgi:hypothetical protein